MSHERMSLVVDDEPADLELLRNAVADLGYEVLTASDGAAAMREFYAHREEIDLLVMDVAMAPMNGCELAANLLKARPNIRVVFVSGYVGTEAFRYRSRLTRAFACVRKPFKAADLQAEVRDVLAAVA